MAQQSTARVVVDGVEDEVRVDEHLLDEVLLPRLRRVARQRAAGRRSLAFLVGPPGSGKSTLGALLRERAGRAVDGLDLDVVGIDGFHHPNAHLAAHEIDTPTGPVAMSCLKGAPETFDLPALAHQLARVRTEDLVWPRYDRRLHDPVAGHEPVRAGLLVVEGTWLLLDEPGWSDLATLSSHTIFLEAPADLLRKRLVRRKVRGGLSPAAAHDFYERSDRLNVERVLRHSDRTQVDLELHLGADGTIQRKARS